MGGNLEDALHKSHLLLNDAFACSLDLPFSHHMRRLIAVCDCVCGTPGASYLLALLSWLGNAATRAIKQIAPQRTRIWFWRRFHRRGRSRSSTSSNELVDNPWSRCYKPRLYTPTMTGIRIV